MVSTTIAIIIAASSLLIGGVSGYYLHSDNQTRDTQTEQNLSEPNLLLKLCKQNGPEFCRELSCRFYTTIRGGASQKECESISNIINSATIYKFCQNEKDPEKCFRLFRERK